MIRVAGRLSGHGHIRLPAHPVLLEEEGDQRRDQQQDRQGGPALHVVHADNGQVSLGGQDRVVSCEDHRISEIGQRLAEHQEERARQSGSRQRERNASEDLPFRSPQVEGRILQCRINGLQHAIEREIGRGKVGQCLDNEQAIKPIDLKLDQVAQDHLADETLLSEQQDGRQATS